MNNAKDLIKQLGNLDKKGPVLNLSRRMSGAHANLAVRKRSLRYADVNYFKMKSDLTSIQVWLEETEKALRSGDEHKIKVNLFLMLYKSWRNLILAFIRLSEDRGSVKQTVLYCLKCFYKIK